MFTGPSWAAGAALVRTAAARTMTEENFMVMVY
jgi:hypothetical protein